VDFARFLGTAPARDFDLHRFFRWPCYWDYGSGLTGARLAPLLTAIQWLLGSAGPARASLSGGTWRWKDGRDVPDALLGTFDYAEGFTAVLSATQNGGTGREIRLIGTEAALVLTDRSATVLPNPQREPYVPLAESWPKEYRDWFYMMHGMSPLGEVRRQFPAERVEERIELPHGAPDSLAAHLANFIECVRMRAEPREPLQLGLQAAEALTLATEAYRSLLEEPGRPR
jgi:predicted dehydrogenase